MTVGELRKCFEQAAEHTEVLVTTDDGYLTPKIELTKMVCCPDCGWVEILSKSDDAAKRNAIDVFVIGC